MKQKLYFLLMRIFGKKIITYDSSNVHSDLDVKLTAYGWRGKTYVHKVEYVPRRPPEHVNCRCVGDNNA